MPRRDGPDRDDNAAHPRSSLAAKLAKLSFGAILVQPRACFSLARSFGPVPVVPCPYYPTEIRTRLLK